MMNKSKKIISLILAGAVALPLAACSTETSESAFDDPLPWPSVAKSYERLDYTTEIFDTTAGTSESKRVKIADGTMYFELEQLGTNTEQEISFPITSVKMSFTVTYADNKQAGADAGLTDTITSEVRFHAQSLAASYMKKTVALAPRKDKTDLSYELTADYFGTQKATYRLLSDDEDKTKTMSLSRDPGHDNEMMFYLARAQSLVIDASSTFYMTNIYDSFLVGELTTYKMSVSAQSRKTVDLGDWVKDYGVEAATDEESGKTSYPVKCINTIIQINAERSGPAYNVLFSDTVFSQNGIEHKKLPVQMDYSQYLGTSPYRKTVYTLSSCSFEK